MIKINKFFYLVAFSLLFSFLVFNDTFARSWTDDADQSIYQRVYDEEQQEAVQEELEGLDSIYDGADGDVLGDLFGKLFISVGDGLYKMLAGVGFDLNSIIYGRVGGSAYLTNDISLFTYELKNGNIYGIVSMYMFDVMRSNFSLFIFWILWYRLMTFIYSNGNAKSRERLKESVTSIIILFLLMLLLPKLLDIALYVRDTILYVSMVKGGELINTVGSTLNSSWDTAVGTGTVAFDFYGTGGDYNLVGMFKSIVNNDSSFVNACMYLGIVLVQLYFGLVYISSAVAMVILVVAFPLVCALETVERGVMSDWLKQVIGIILNPIIDSCLILIPMMFAVLGYKNHSIGYSFIALIVCSCIIPARGVIRVLLRLGNGMGFELAGLGAAFGAMRIGHSIAKNVGGLLSRAKEGYSSANNDENMADLYDEQAQRLDLDSINDDEKMEGLFGDQARFGLENNELQRIGESELEGMSPEERAHARNENMRQGLETLDERKSNLTDEIKQEESKSADISQEMADIDNHTAELKAERASLDSKNPENHGVIQEIDQKIAENDVDKRLLSSEQARIRSENSYRKEQINEIDNFTKQAKNKIIGMKAGGVGSGYSRGGTTEEYDDQALLNRYANIENFEMPTFKNISLERKADLYRKRAKQTRLRSVGSMSVGAIGGLTGAAVGFGGTTFFSPTAKMYGVSSFMDAGVTTGNVAGDVIGSKISGFKSTRNPRQTKRHSSTISNNISGYVEQPIISARTVAESDYSDYDQTERHYERTASNYKPNWSLPEEERYRYESVFQGIMSSGNSGKTLNQNIKRTMREASVIARQSKDAIKMEGKIPKTETERSEMNQIIVEEALDSFSRSLSENILLSEASKYVANSDELDFDEFGRYLEERFSNSSRNQLKSYLKSKGTLF